jgi:hypothetical protein
MFEVKISTVCKYQIAFGQEILSGQVLFRLEIPDRISSRQVMPCKLGPLLRTDSYPSARLDLGVVYATKDGSPMSIVDSQNMRCSKSATQEPRKVAILSA